MERECERCGSKYRSRNQNTGDNRQKYCSDTCRKASQTLNSGLHLPSGTVGAIAELVISNDLLIKGFEVFRALSPSCSCDLIAINKDYSTRLEVRSGYRTNVGTLVFPKNNFRADRYAIYVYRTNEILYIPELPKQL